MNLPISKERRITEHLANERTFLAWIRTCISIISLGFVVAKFSVWMREIAVRLDPSKPIPAAGISMPVGVIMMAFGGMLAIFAAWQHYRVKRAIEEGTIHADSKLVFIVTFAVALLATLMIVYLVITSEHL